jgi:histidine triad (HIT) family protein
MDECIFCRIVKGDLPAYKVWEDDQTLAFLSIDPHTHGHTLLIPKKHVDYIFDNDDETLAKLLVNAKHIAGALKKAFNPKTGKVAMMAVGLEVAHTHIHLIPLNAHEDMNVGVARPRITPEQFLEHLQKIKSQL